MVKIRCVSDVQETPLVYVLFITVKFILNSHMLSIFQCTCISPILMYVRLAVTTHVDNYVTSSLE